MSISPVTATIAQPRSRRTSIVSPASIPDLLTFRSTLRTGGLSYPASGVPHQIHHPARGFLASDLPPAGQRSATLPTGRHDLLRRLQDETGLAIVLITHDLGVVADLCTRAVVMYAGEVVETAASRRCSGPRPAYPYTKALLESNPIMGQPRTTLRSIPGTVPSPAMWPAGPHPAPSAGRLPEPERHALVVNAYGGQPERPALGLVRATARRPDPLGRGADVVDAEGQLHLRLRVP
jgi:hypothetical protein